MPGVSSPAVKEASESQIMIFILNMQDLCLQAFQMISVKLCCKGLSEMSQGTGMWFLGCMQGISTSPLDISGGRFVPVHWRWLWNQFRFGFLGEVWRDFAPEKLGVSLEKANSCWLSYLLTCINQLINSILRVQTKHARREWEIM